MREMLLPLNTSTFQPTPGQVNPFSLSITASSRCIAGILAFGLPAPLILSFIIYVLNRLLERPIGSMSRARLLDNLSSYGPGLFAR